MSIDTDSLTRSSLISLDDNEINLIKSEHKKTTRTQQIKLRRGLLDSGRKEKSTKEKKDLNLIDINSIINKVPDKPNIQLITFQEANKYFESILLPNQNQTQKKPQKKEAFCCDCSSENLNKQKYYIANLKAIKYDDKQDIHFRILFSIYYFFTKRNCTKRGEHWLDIGFQDINLTTDLISVCMYGPLQILYGITYYPNLFTNMFQFLLKRKCNLFYMNNLLSFCKFTYNDMEREVVDCGEGKNLFVQLNEIFVGMSYAFFNDIKNYCIKNSLTIEFIVKTIQEISQKRTRTEDFLNNHKNCN